MARLRFASLTIAALLAPLARAAPPNVLVIYADDLGWGDVRCYNPERGRIPTPHLDRLAGAGMRFTDAHSSSGVCSPSRYTLLTGRYHWRTRLQRGIVNVWEPPLIAADRLTLGGLAGRAGYRTACIGKWHLGWDWPITAADRPLVTGYSGQDRNAPPPVTPAHQAAWRRTFSQPIGGGPTTRGFDRYFGTDVPNWPPYCFIDGDRTVGVPETLLPAADFEHHRASLQGPALTDWKLEAILPALRDKAVAFVTEAARDDVPFLLYLPLTSPHTPLAVNAAWRSASGLDNACADLVMETDAVVGDLLTTLDETGVADDTLVIFTSDNGFAPYVGAAALEARGHFPSGPYRGYKGDAWEGGHRVAFIVRWPGVVPAGRVCHALVHQADVFATVAEAIGGTVPADAGEDSFSFLPLLRGGTEATRDQAVSCGLGGLPAFRAGSWKLVLGRGSGGWSKGAPDGPPVQLYDLATDPGETQNLAAKQPERVADMTDAYRRLVTAGRSSPGPKARNDVAVQPYPHDR